MVIQSSLRQDSWTSSSNFMLLFYDLYASLLMIGLSYSIFILLIVYSLIYLRYIGQVHLPYPHIYLILMASFCCCSLLSFLFHGFEAANYELMPI